ncbi:MAG: hypothetical protein K5873_01745 [Treponema sp.]|nr:hypothetical protein [Treponema sp.]
MSENKKIYFYIASNLAFLIPVPGRFAYALILVLLFNIQMSVTTLLFHGIYRLQLANLRNAILSLTIIALGIFYKQVLSIYCPIASLTLGYCIFLPTLASVIIEFFFLEYSQYLKKHLIVNVKTALAVSSFSLVFFLIRDIFGYGTITFPGWKHIIVFHLPYNSSGTGASVFMATIPGSLICIAIFLAAYIFVMNKFRIYKNSPEGQEAKK